MNLVDRNGFVQSRPLHIPVEDTLVPDGTYFLTGGELTGYKKDVGYIVGMPGGISNHARVTTADLIQLAQRGGWELFGVWVDSETGIQYIDPVQWKLNLWDAFALARDNGELAIWNLYDNVEIRVDK